MDRRFALYIFSFPLSFKNAPKKPLFISDYTLFSTITVCLLPAII